jgi:hypothetical protein
LRCKFPSLTYCLEGKLNRKMLKPPQQFLNPL